MSYKLEKPLSIKQRADFIVEYNHNKGLQIEETDEALYALEAWEGVNEQGEVISNKEAWEAEQVQKEKERVAKLYLTGADVERGIYQAKGLDFDDIIALIENAQQPSPDGEGAEGGWGNIDIKALKIELKANHFYRGNSYVNAVGALLGFTEKMLDKFFETNDYTCLLTEE